MSTEPQKRRWFQFRLRTLFVLVTVVCVGLRWLEYERQKEKVRERREWFQSVTKFGAWNRRLGEPPGDDALAYTIDVDKTIKLIATGNAATDEKLVHLAGLSHLRELTLFGTQITDDGLELLHGLANLQVLNLPGTLTTPEGRQKLRQALPNTKIYPEP